MKFSLIIPAYNVEDFLQDCLLSIKNQSFSDFEVLIVDDGSEDDTGRIAQEFADSDNRFKVLAKENGGVSTARNLGLEQASGEFVWFIDGDDYIHPESLAYLEKIYSTYPDADYVTFPFTQVFNPYSTCRELEKTLSLDEVALFDCCTEQGFIRAFRFSPREACLTCYKRSILENEKFGPFKVGEDTLFAKQILYKSKKVIWVPVPLYYYYFREKSASHTMLLSSVMDYLKVCRELFMFKGEKGGWADKALARFCFEVGLVDGMTRLQSLSVSHERHIAHQAWIANAAAFLDVFAESSIQKRRLQLICWARSFRLSWLLFYVRYMPRRFIAKNHRLAAILRATRILSALKEREKIRIWALFL